MFQGKSRENVLYVKLDRYDEKHPCAKSKHYGGTDARKSLLAVPPTVPV